MAEEIKTKRLYIVIIVAGFIAVALGLLLLKSHSDMEEMVEVFTEEKEVLLNDYRDLYTDYDSLKSNNAEINDKLDQERERVAQLQEELKTVKATNARRIKELQGELTTLRTVMRSFVRQIDSLNSINVKLAAENDKMRTQVRQVRESYNALADENKSLTQQVEIAARLEASAISAVGLNYKEKTVKYADKTNKIKINFTLLKNVTAQCGMRPVYLRLTRPDGQLLMHSKDDLFKYEDSQINYSSKRDIEYGGEDTPTYIVYNVDAGELMSGQYSIELFCGGEIIGKSTFNLK